MRVELIKLMRALMALPRAIVTFAFFTFLPAGIALAMLGLPDQWASQHPPERVKQAGGLSGGARLMALEEVAGPVSVGSIVVGQGEEDRLEPKPKAPIIQAPPRPVTIVKTPKLEPEARSEKPEKPAYTTEEVITFNGRPLRLKEKMRMTVTAYSPDERSCGQWADGYTASGKSVLTNGMKLVAADTRLLPFGSIVSVPGYNNGKPVPVLDRGGKIKGQRLDVLFPTHEIALEWGVQELEVMVWEYAD